MIRLVTQYTDKLFANGKGYDGTSGGHCYHIIDCDNVQRLKSQISGNYMNPIDWVDTARHLNSFRLWFVYEQD